MKVVVHIFHEAKSKLLRPLLFLAAVGAVQGQPSSTPREDFWVTDGIVQAMGEANGILYVGGAFNNLGPYTGGGAPLDTRTAKASGAFPGVNGSVRAVAPDGQGGWFIGGAFNQVGQAALTNLAHIRSDGTVDIAWSPHATGGQAPQVNSLAVLGNTIYVGGSFTSLGGQARLNLAALNAVNSQPMAWNPSASDAVNVLLLADNKLYVGGSFTNISGQERLCVAALDTVSGQALEWNPKANSNVMTMAVSGTDVYAGGLFTLIGGKARRGLAALDVITGQATDWNPQPFFTSDANGVFALAVVGTNVYVGGSFSGIGNVFGRSGIGAVGVVGGRATAWNPSGNNFPRPLSEVYTLVVSGNTVYAGGRFTRMGGQPRNHVVALDATTGQATDWNPRMNGPVLAIALSGNTLFAGGEFNSFGGESRSNLAALDVNSGRVTAWNPSPNSNVLALAVSENRVYIGGAFNRIGASVRNRIAAVDLTNGTATTWNPNANGIIQALAVAGGTIYAGGKFKTIGGQTRNYVAALDTATGLAKDWNANIAVETFNEVSALAVAGNTVYAGGNFTEIGVTEISGQLRNSLAALDALTAVVISWNPSVNGTISTLLLAGNTVYAGGSFIKIGVQTRNNLAAINATTGKPMPWNPGADGAVKTMALADNTIYVGGNFLTLGGQPRGGLAGVDLVSGQVTAWDPLFSGGDDPTVQSLAVTGGVISVGGSFTTVDNLGRRGLASFALGPVSGAVNFVPAAARVLVDGKFQCRLGGSGGRRLIVQGSPDLARWLNLSTNTLNGAAFDIEFTDASVAGEPLKFYRAVLEP